MATFLSKLFKPKWQSKHFETRKQALSELDALNADELNILTQLAETDPSSDIQILAIQKISDTSTLIALHKKSKDTLKPAIEKRLYDLATAQSLSIFDLIIDLDLLTSMIIKSHQADAYIRGLARIQDAKVLLKIATQSKNAHIRQAAAELIETEQELNDLFHHAKGKDKAVYHITKTKLADIRTRVQQHAEQQTLIEKLLSDLDKLSKTEALQHFEARLSHIITQWEAIKEHTNSTQQSSFSSRLTQCKQKQDAREPSHAITQTEITENSKHDNSESNQEIAETISTLQSTLTRFQTNAAKTLEISALDALVKTQENRWIEAAREADITKGQQRSYQDGMTQLRDYLNAMRAFSEQQEHLTAHIESLSKLDDSPNNLNQQRTTLKSILKTINWPSHFVAPEDINKANQALESSKERKEALTEKQKSIEESITKQLKVLDTFIEEKQIKESIKQLKDIQGNLNKLDTQRADKFQAGITLRKNQLNELKDWQGFISTPKQEALCLAMTRLADTHIAPAEKADKIKAMQQEWKKLGGTADQELWVRFKTAADKAYEPCALFFAEQKQLKEANLVKRQTLLQQVKDYIESVEWEKVSSQHTPSLWQSSDWKTAEKINRQAKQEWREAFPIDFKANKIIQNEFNTLIDTFDTYIEQERQYNIGLKDAIVEEAKALTDAENIDASIQAVKSLQEKWQQVGITHHKADRKLWSAYRAACDELFAKRNTARDEKRTEQNEAIKAANTLCESIETSCAALDTKSHDELKALLSSTRKQAETIPAIPTKIREKISQRLERVTSSIKSEIKQREKNLKLAEWLEISRKANMLRAAYFAATEGQPVTDNMDDFTSKVVLEASIEKQLDDIWKQIQEGNTHTFKMIDDIQAREMCISSEVAAGIDSPEEDKALRMQLQVSRLSEGLSSNNGHISREAQLESALKNWYLSFGINPAILAHLEPRIEHARDTLLG